MVKTKADSAQINKNRVFLGLLVSITKIFLVFIVTMTFIMYIVAPPFSHAFFTHDMQSNTIVRTVEPV